MLCAGETLSKINRDNETHYPLFLQSLFYVTALISLLLLNVIHSGQAHHKLKTHLQTGSLLIMEVQIPAALGCHLESNWVESGQHVYENVPKISLLESNCWLWVAFTPDTATAFIFILLAIWWSIEAKIKKNVNHFRNKHCVCQVSF